MTETRPKVTEAVSLIMAAGVVNAVAEELIVNGLSGEALQYLINIGELDVEQLGGMTPREAVALQQKNHNLSEVAKRLTRQTGKK